MAAPRLDTNHTYEWVFDANRRATHIRLRTQLVDEYGGMQFGSTVTLDLEMFKWLLDNAGAELPLASKPGFFDKILARQQPANPLTIRKSDIGR